MFGQINLDLLIVLNAFRKNHAPVLASVPVTTSELVLGLKAFNTIFLLIKRLKQLITNFSVVPKQEIETKNIFLQVVFKVVKNYWYVANFTFPSNIAMTRITGSPDNIMESI